MSKAEWGVEKALELMGGKSAFFLTATVTTDSFGHFIFKTRQ